MQHICSGVLIAYLALDMKQRSKANPGQSRTSGQVSNTENCPTCLMWPVLHSFNIQHKHMTNLVYIHNSIMNLSGIMYRYNFSDNKQQWIKA